jgi:hypothetical protein
VDRWLEKSLAMRPRQRQAEQSHWCSTTLFILSWTPSHYWSRSSNRHLAIQTTRTKSDGGNLDIELGIAGMSGVSRALNNEPESLLKAGPHLLPWHALRLLR